MNIPPKMVTKDLKLKQADWHPSSPPTKSTRSNRRSQQCRTLLKVPRILESAPDLDSALHQLSMLALELVSMQGCQVWLTELDQQMTIGAQSSTHLSASEHEYLLEVARQAATQGRCLHLPDPAVADQLGANKPVPPWLHNLLALPLNSRHNNRLGVLLAINKTTGSFNAEDQELLHFLATHLALAIQQIPVLQVDTRQRTPSFCDRIIGNSQGIREVIATIRKVSDMPVNVLIMGESGTGKDLVANAIHDNSRRHNQAFVAINCAALPESLLESELFGIEKGVATGVDQRIGKIELAHGGTLFLDEIGDMSLTTQAKILRVLQEREFERIGGNKTIKVDVRILAASNKDLLKQIQSGQFREDLYYRLNVVPIFLLPLRERRDDIPLLVEHILQKACVKLSKRIRGVSRKAMQALMDYSWPGNVRELENEIERAVSLSGAKEMIDYDGLSPKIREHQQTRPPGQETLPEAVQRLEKRMIIDTLSACNGNKTRAARQLGISREGLRKKLKRYRLL